MTNRSILFVGDEIEVQSERDFTAALRRDLVQLGVPVVVYANFLATGSGPQIDTLVRTPMRTMHIEIKGLADSLPAHGGVNGDWEQHRSDGTTRSLGSNFGRQALRGTYGISDFMRTLARKGLVPQADFKKHIDTVVGFWKRIPPGSHIETPPFVTALGYDEVIALLQVPGPTVPWGDDDWDTFAHEQRLYQPEAQLAPEDRAARNDVADYCDRFAAAHASEQSNFVELGLLGTDGSEVSPSEVAREIADGGRVAVLGPSGHGKSMLAERVGVELSRAGRVVIWVRAGSFEHRFRDLLPPATAPFSTRRWDALVRAAESAGSGVTVVLDGLNECPADLRPRLLENVSAFLNTHPASLLVTTTEAAGLFETLGTAVLRSRVPFDDQRARLLVAHGANQPDRISAQFSTPYELGIAAECENEAGPGATLADVHDILIRRFASGPVRTGLRALAANLSARLRTSMRRTEATSVLAQLPNKLTPAQLDEVLDCHLVVAEGRWLRFRHELVGQFLTAESLVEASSTGSDLGQRLLQPANSQLVEAALQLSGDSPLTWEAIEELASEQHITRALNGEYGIEVRRLATARVRNALTTATNDMRSRVATFEATADDHFGRWVLNRPLARVEVALFAAAGAALGDGMFVEEVARLLDATDEVCSAYVRPVESGGAEVGVNRVVGTTYVLQTGDHSPAVLYVRQAAERARMLPCVANSGRRSAVAQILDGATPQSWGRLHVAAALADPDNDDDQRLMPELVRLAWQSGAYHVRQFALYSAERFHGSQEPFRTELLDVLRDLETGNLWLSTTLVETLAAFGDIDSGVDVDDLRRHIEGVTAQMDDRDAQIEAARILNSRFETEEIVGPYSEAIGELDEDAELRLHIMAALGQDLELAMFFDGTLRSIAERVPTGDAVLDAAAKAAFQRVVEGSPADNMMRGEAERTWLAGISGWAKFEGELPQQTETPDRMSRLWALFAQLLLRYERDDSVCDPEDVWQDLRADWAGTAAILARLMGADRGHVTGHTYDAVSRLVDDFPVELKRLAEQALDSPVLPDHQEWKLFGSEVPEMALWVLARVGDESSILHLDPYLLDPSVGRSAAEAIRNIHDRAAR